jgi:hypothetical protein
MPGQGVTPELQPPTQMKSDFPFLLLPLLLFVLLFELFWVRERSPEVAPPRCEKSESKPGPKAPREKMPEEKPRKQAVEKGR